MRLKLLLILAVLFLAASPVFAQTAATGGGTGLSKSVVAGIGMAIASGLCGLAQGRATAGASEAVARNPGATAAIRFFLILGLALIESLALYTLVIIYTV